MSDTFSKYWNCNTKKWEFPMSDTSSIQLKELQNKLLIAQQEKDHLKTLATEYTKDALEQVEICRELTNKIAELTPKPTLEVGHYYLARDGRKAWVESIREIENHFDHTPFREQFGPRDGEQLTRRARVHYADGTLGFCEIDGRFIGLRSSSGEGRDSDLVSEWESEPNKSKNDKVRIAQLEDQLRGTERSLATAVKARLEVETAIRRRNEDSQRSKEALSRLGDNYDAALKLLQAIARTVSWDTFVAHHGLHEENDRLLSLRGKGL